MQDLIENMSPPPGKRIMDNTKEVEQNQIEDGSGACKFPVNGSPYTNSCQKNVADEEEGIGEKKKQQMPPASVMTRLILIMVWRKLIRNPNTYSSLLGLAWSLISYRYHTLTSKCKVFIIGVL